MKLSICHPNKKHAGKGLCDSCYYKEQRKKFPDRYKQYRIKFKKTHPDIYKKYRSSEHSKKIRKEYARKHVDYYIKRRKRDDHFRIACNLRNRIGKVLRGKNKSASTVELLGCSIEFLKIYLENKFKPKMSWENYGEWHIDHIKPCANFNFLDPSQQKKCFHYSNLQPLWAKENIRKGCK